MKHFFYAFCLLSLSSLSACSDEEVTTSQEVGDGVQVLPPSRPNEVIDARLFECINLDYPGLEKVKEFYENNEYYYAANELLKYYRNRSDIFNTGINLVNPSITASEKRIADQALENRFYVRNFEESGEGENAVYYSFEKDGKIDWNFIPEGIEDQEFASQKHRHQWLPAQGKAYRVTGDEKYFNSWKTVYTSWLETFPCPEGKVSKDQVEWYGLQPTERLVDQIDVFAYFIQSSNFTPEWLSAFLVAFYDHVECVRNNYFTDGGNIEAAMYQAVTTAGILMPEFTKSAEWLQEGAAAMGKQVTDQFLEDGVQNELDPSYHIGVVAGFYDMYQLALQNGKLSLFPENYTEQLRNSARFVMDIIYPNYTIDNFNDTRSVSWTKNVLLKNLKKYVDMFPDDQELRWVAYEGRQGSKPSYRFKAYDKAGYYMLRNGWDASSMMMILKNNNNPENKWHCQPDNGTFGLYRNGRNFFPDAGVYSYGGTSSSNADRQTYLATKNHNTMTDLSKTIANGFMNGKMLKHETQSGNVQLLVTENQSYANLTHRRAVFFVEDKFFVLVDEGYGNGNSDKINLNFHLLSDAQYVTAYDDLSASGQFGAHTTFDSNNLLIRTVAETAQDFSVSTVDSNTSNDLGKVTGTRKGYQYTIRKPANGAARFITVLYPFDKTSDLSGLNIEARFTDNSSENAGTFHQEGAAVSVKIGEKEYQLKYTL